MTRYVIEVNIGPGDVWKPVRHYYRDKATAKDWTSFVRAAWHLRTRVAKVIIPWVNNKPEVPA